MTTEEIKSNLCYYDKRNPDCIANDDDDIEYHNEKVIRIGKCFCDNCFYGRTQLAEELLKYIKTTQ